MKNNFNEFEDDNDLVVDAYRVHMARLRRGYQEGVSSVAEMRATYKIDFAGFVKENSVDPSPIFWNDY